MELNTLYNRNTQPKFWEENKESHSLNCGSFALGVDTWFCPYIEDDDELEDSLWMYSGTERRNWIEELVYEGHELEDIMVDVIDRDFEFILKTCPWLEPIDVEDITDKDRVIAYRLSMEIPECRDEFDCDEYMDFHFRVLLDGEWWEKNGGAPVHYVCDYIDEEPWVVEDWIVYSGPIRYARFKTI